MAIEIKIGDRIAWANLLKQEGNILEIDVDGKIYNVDLMHTADGTFSILEGGHSYNIELVPEGAKKYTAYTLYDTFDVEVIDAEARYLINRNANGTSNGDNKVSSPMPGKVINVLVKEGQEVIEGETLVIISAMKMESEYKSPKDGTIKKVHVQADETIDSNQVLIELE